MDTAFSALLLSNDSQSLFVVERALDHHDVAYTSCATGLAAHNAFKERRFDVLLVDLELAGAAELLELQVGPKLSYSGPVIALCADPTKISEPLRKRLDYVLAKPFTDDLVARTLRAAYTMAVAERRTAFRCPVGVSAFASFQERCIKQPLKAAMVLDVSQMGLCLKGTQPLPVGATAFVDFQLPGTADVIHVIGKVMWSKPIGHSGIEFRFVPPAEFSKLRSWLSSRFPLPTELAAKLPAYQPTSAGQSARI